MPSVREAGEGDARAIAAVHVLAWEAAYRGLLPDEVLDRLAIDDRERGWQQVLGEQVGDSFTLVATFDGVVAGFCAVVAPSRDEDAGQRTAEVAATYVDPQAWRSGVGSVLLRSALSRIRDGGWQEATLWLFDRNDQARAFYTTFGFERDGAETTHEWAGGQVAVRLSRAL